MVRIASYCSALLMVYSCASSARSEHYEICVSDSLRITHVTETIQTVHAMRHDSRGSSVKERILIGNIVSYGYEGGALFGQFSTAHFEEDELAELAGPNEKDGYFVIDARTGLVESGKDKTTLDRVLRERYGIQSASLKKVSRADSCARGGT